MKRWLLVGLLVVAGAAPPDLSLFAYRQQTGSRLPLQSLLREADGRSVRVGELSQGLPLILVPGYFHCPNLCGLTRQDLFSALAATGLQAGHDYALALVSIDPDETASDASVARAQDLTDYKLAATGSLHYLTGAAGDIQAVADAVGFHDKLDAQTKQFIHPAGIVFATPGGVVSSYLLGLGYTPTDIRTALYRAGAGGIAESGSPVLLICFHFDPSTGRYTLAVEKLLRLAAVLTVVTIGGTMALLFRRERTRA